MPYERYQRPYGPEEKAAYKAGLKKGQQLAGQQPVSPQTPAERSAAALEGILAVLQKFSWKAEPSDFGPM